MFTISPEEEPSLPNMPRLPQDPPANTYYAKVPRRLCTSPVAAELTIAALLDAEVARNDCASAAAYDTMTPFHALEAPTIGVAAYVARLSQYAFSSTACLLTAYHYVKRVSRADPALAPTSLSVHRLLITAVVLAAKYLDDVTYSMGYYAKVGGLPTKELAYLELRMLSQLGFRLHVSPADFHTLEADLADALRFLPRTAPAERAAAALSAARIAAPERTRYCEALHDSDVFGLWRPHPTPRRVMVAHVEALGSPVTSPGASPARELASPACGSPCCSGDMSAAAAAAAVAAPAPRPVHAPPRTGPLRHMPSTSSTCSASGTPGHTPKFLAREPERGVAVARGAAAYDDARTQAQFESIVKRTVGGAL